MGKNIYPINRPADKVDAWALDTFLSHNDKNGLHKDVQRAHPLQDGVNIHDEMYISVAPLYKYYKYLDPAVFEHDMQGVLGGIDSHIVQAVLKNQMQGRGINNDVAWTMLPDETRPKNDFIDRYIFQDIVPNTDNDTVKVTDISLQQPGMSLGGTFFDVSFLEERSYTYAWVSVADEIQKYQHSDWPRDWVPELGILGTNLYNYTTELTVLQEYVADKINLDTLISQFLARAGLQPTDQQVEQLFPEHPDENASFSLYYQDGSLSIQEDGVECPFIFMSNKWIPQFMVGRTADNAIHKADFRLRDGVLQKISTTDHTSTVRMLCDEQDASQISNERLGLEAGNLPSPVMTNVSAIHLHLEFIQQVLQKMADSNYTAAYRTDIATQLLKNFFAALSSKQYRSLTDLQKGTLKTDYEIDNPHNPLSSLMKDLRRGAHEDFHTLKQAFTKAGVDPKLIEDALPKQANQEVMSIALAAVGLLIVAAAVAIYLFSPFGIVLQTAILLGAKATGLSLIGLSIYTSPTLKHFFLEHSTIPPHRHAHISSSEWVVQEDKNRQGGEKRPDSPISVTQVDDNDLGMKP
jgi:hypothetical protein